MGKKYQIMVLLMGVVGISSLIIFGFNLQSTVLAVGPLVGSTQMVGHFSVTEIDKDGNIVAYRQTDNVGTVEGGGCLAVRAFSATGACASNATPFNQVAIGDSTVSPCTYLATNTGVLGGLITGTVANPVTGLATITAGPTDLGAGAGPVETEITLAATITLGAGGAANIDNAVVQDSNGNTLSGQCFAATPGGPDADINVEFVYTSTI